MMTKRGRRAADTENGETNVTDTMLDAPEGYGDTEVTEDAPDTDTENTENTEGTEEGNGKRHYVKATDKFNFPASLSPAEDVPEDEVIPYSRDTAERDESQKIVDADVKAAYDAWAEAGKPAFKNRGRDLPSKRYIVPPENVEAVNYMLDRAAKLHDVGIRRAPVADHSSGRKIVQFWAMDKRQRKSKETASENGGQETGQEDAA